MPRRPPESRAERDFNDGVALVARHPLFAALHNDTEIVRREGTPYLSAGWLRVTSRGQIIVHPTRRETPGSWAYALAHALLHLGFGHFVEREDPHAWAQACDIAVYRFLAGMRFGEPPARFADHIDPFVRDLPGGDESSLYEALRGPLGARVPSFALSGGRELDFTIDPAPRVRPTWWKGKATPFPELLALGLQRAVAEAVETAATGRAIARNDSEVAGTRNARRVARAREWFVTHYPLLGALAASFDLITDPKIVVGEHVSIAAVNPRLRELYVNAAAGLTEPQTRFVIAHELLHVALQTGDRAHGRDPYLWNVAADFVINGWLVEMGVGEMPTGLLHDPDLAGLSAESVYDRIVTDSRRMRKLATLRGIGIGDVLDDPTRRLEPGEAIDLDAFYRDALAQGYALHEVQGRGLLPAGLSDAIRALSQPPIGLDVELARWMDSFLLPLEKRRSYARPSRRQAAASEIPLPRYVAPEPDLGRTFGVVIDTSGSMGRTMLGESLGAIASYAAARDVSAVRVVSCDAAAYDHGYVAPETIADRMILRGRGGTVLQPGIDLLERARDFPVTGPILVITDGFCDAFVVRRKHAILLPAGRPFLYATGSTPIFRFREERH